MTMNAQTVGWLVFLSLIKNFTCQEPPFKIEERQLTALEGTCTEIKCTVTESFNDEAYWFWMKDAEWFQSDFNATVIYSTDHVKRPVSPDFADRVKYIGTSFIGRYFKDSLCSILICNLKKTDSGQYSFRFAGKNKVWVTKKNVTLTVTDNPCLITFNKPPVVKEAGNVKLTCSTSNSCSSNLKIEAFNQTSSAQLPQHEEKNTTTKSTIVSFSVTVQDDGKVFSCQTQNNKDTYAIQNISVTVEYAPKDIKTEISSENIKEGDYVTLTCAANGGPNPSITWFRNGQQQFSGAEWKISSINESQNGTYQCEAKNTHGTISSNSLTINVQYAPYVEIQMDPSVVKEGDKVTLTCEVKRSNPSPSAFLWRKDGINIGYTNTYMHHRVKPEDSGFYTCAATNDVDTRESDTLQIKVEYSPRNTHISLSAAAPAKVGFPFTLTCNTDANPNPSEYSWYRFNKDKPLDSLMWKSKATSENSLYFPAVQRADEAYYICNATNSIGTGDDSLPEYMQVWYPPTEPKLSMDTEVMEGQSISISCTVESFPPSTLIVTGRLNPQSSEQPFIKLTSESQRANTLHHRFNVTLVKDTYYTCIANNTEGSSKSIQHKLVVKYAPKYVTVQAQPGLVVNENTSLTLTCSAQSYPPVTKFIWMKMTDRKDEVIHTSQIYTLKSASPSDRGLYSCEATNDAGKRKSQQAEVKVKYGPKKTNITTSAEQQKPDGRSYVVLSCSSDSYPLVTSYLWYKKDKREFMLFNQQNYTVYSDNPGDYYCIAKNEIGQGSSELVHLFVNRHLMKILKFFFIFLITLIILLIFLVCRHRKKTSIQQGSTNTQPCFGFLVWWNRTRRGDLTNESVLADPFRSRDDLLANHPCRPMAQRQPRPDNIPASNINSVYCTVNLPTREQAPTTQKPTGQQEGGITVYDSLQLEDRKGVNWAKAEADVYAKVSRPKPAKKNKEENQADYENVCTGHASKFPNDDTDTSEEEEVNYSQVSIRANPGHWRSSSDSSSDSSTSDDEIQYSEVKL
ncbi:B-cell receptor CD22 [Mastacembelus armatus]|uniref:B-cell receptor CD22 n=1 Tax=Mastacembelus armatus TaxID=205130 RepID=A0A3Q3LJU8_9TELE|nr:B-cell receptor CD22-like [Mastacembelus armatus]XP_026172634.1 B-cell receptor CD22-like [Mastacembelus armatus]